MLPKELSRLITARATTYVAKKAEDAARETENDARRDLAARGVRTEREAAAHDVFAWIASSQGQELLATMRATGLGHVLILHGAAALSVDGSVELHHKVKWLGARETFASSDAYIAWANELTGSSDSRACLDTPLYALADVVRDGTILDRITDLLRSAS
jgi:hypothetical protein